MADADGGGVTQLTRGGSEIGYRDPQFSPDGETIVFVREDHSPPKGYVNSAIYAMDSDGTDPRRLTSGGLLTYYRQPTFSPTGDRIAFQKNDHIFVMRKDGSDITQLTEGDAPAFSPDGSQIVFTRFSAEGCSRTGCAAEYGDLYVVNADGSDPERLRRRGSDNEDRLLPDWGPRVEAPGNDSCASAGAMIVGTDLRDHVWGTAYGDVIQAGAGNDAIFGAGGADRICGGRGDDRLRGGRSFDRCFGGKGVDTTRCERSRP